MIEITFQSFSFHVKEFLLLITEKCKTIAGLILFKFMRFKFTFFGRAELIPLHHRSCCEDALNCDRWDCFRYPYFCSHIDVTQFFRKLWFKTVSLELCVRFLKQILDAVHTTNIFRFQQPLIFDLLSFPFGIQCLLDILNCPLWCFHFTPQRRFTHFWERSPMIL